MIVDVFHKRRVWRWLLAWSSKPFDFDLDEFRFDSISIDDRARFASDYPPDYKWTKATTWEELIRIVRIEYPGMWRFVNVPVRKWMVPRDGDKKTWVETGEIVKEIRLADVSLSARYFVHSAENRERGFRVVETFATIEDYARATARPRETPRESAELVERPETAQVASVPAPGASRLRIEAYLAIEGHTRIDGIAVSKISAKPPDVERVVAALEPFEAKDYVQTTETGIYRRTLTPRDRPVAILCPEGAELKVKPRGAFVVWPEPGKSYQAAASPETAYRYASEGRFGFELEDGPIVAPEPVPKVGDSRQLTLF